MNRIKESLFRKNCIRYTLFLRFMFTATLTPTLFNEAVNNLVPIEK